MTGRSVRLGARGRDSVSPGFGGSRALMGRRRRRYRRRPTRGQSDAESWLGETWRELAAAGIAQVTLFEDGTLVYGPMPLTEG